MKKVLFVISFLFIFGNVFAYKELIIENRGGLPVRVIKVVLDGQHYVVSSVANDGGDTLENLTKKVGGDTAVNGVFFCPADYTYCNGLTHTISERVYMGNGEDYSRFWPDTSIRAIFGFDKYGEPLLVQNNFGISDIGYWSNINKDRQSDLYFGLGNFPVLLEDGDDVVMGFLNYVDKKMETPGNKSFICSTKDKSTIYLGVVGGLNLWKMPAFIKEQFGCWNAINLDAGASLGMIYSGLVLDRGGRRKIMDAFVVLTRDEYIKLTGITPPMKTEYKPDLTYTLNSEDRKFVDKLDKIIKTIIKQYGSDYKRKIIKLFRDMYSSDKYDLVKKSIFYEILIKTYTVDKL
ncbi:phosphodiester glycosidase family protein [Candidatus Gracilibacteria bacterium]|nr:phosphodiester glycosidase family protein [Candidatus Gracilibacteria bacterium]